MILGFVLELLRTILIRVDGVSLVFSEIIEWVYLYVSDNGAKYFLTLGIEIRILFGSTIGNDNWLSLVSYGGVSYYKRPGGEFVRWLVSKIGTDDVIWMGFRLYLTVGTFKDVFWDYLLVYYLSDQW